MGRYLGIDFGTTNSALAACGDQGPARLATFEGESTWRSVLFFDPDERSADGQLRPHTGPHALDRYLEVGGDGRLIQSIKSHLASRGLVGTSIFGRSVTIEALVARILRDLAEASARELGPLEGPIVVGRPVRYVGSRSPEDDDWAVERTRRAFALAGFPDVHFEYEPVAAAWHYERSLQHDEVLLIADFGGGTTDFCLMRAGPEFRARERDDRILATAGVGLAGDRFDGRILDREVAPLMGKGSTYRSIFDKDLVVPAWYFQQLVRWHRLSMLDTPKNLRDLRGYLRTSHAPERLGAFVHLVENNLGFALAGAVERAKTALSASLRAPLRFVDPPVDLDRVLDRADFEAWIAADLQSIEDCLDELLTRVDATVDRVFMTGGTAFVPAVQAIFHRRFGADRVRSGDHLTSVASGLALVARERARGTT